MFEVDVADARRLPDQNDPPLSLTAFVSVTLGRAVAAHSKVHA